MDIVERLDEFLARDFVTQPAPLPEQEVLLLLTDARTEIMNLRSLGVARVSPGLRETKDELLAKRDEINKTWPLER